MKYNMHSGSLKSAARSVHAVLCSHASTIRAYGTKTVRVPKLASSRGGPMMAMSSIGGRDTHTEATDLQAVARFQQLVPALGGNYKGAHGKVAVVGGCLEFTGAPFFAAMSALRVGADMAYVICTPSAATAIKSYSPELMVLPYLPEMQAGDEDGSMDEAVVARAVSRILPWLSRASAVVLGPGLGADPAVCSTARALMSEVRRLGLPLLVDGSALTHIVAKAADTVVGYRRCILTPNVAELGRIAEAVGLQLPGRMSDAWLEHAPRVAAAFRGPVVMAKGEVDLLCGPEGLSARAGFMGDGADDRGQQVAAGSTELQPLLCCSDPGSLRRCGGQGDVLAGTAAAFLGWASKRKPHASEPAAAAAAPLPSPPSASLPPPGTMPSQAPQPPPRARDEAGDSDLGTTATMALCGYMACKVMRGAARRAFTVGERSMVAGDIIPHLYPTFKQIVGCS